MKVPTGNGILANTTIILLTKTYFQQEWPLKITYEYSSFLVIKQSSHRSHRTNDGFKFEFMSDVGNYCNM